MSAHVDMKSHWGGVTSLASPLVPLLPTDRKWTKDIYVYKEVDY